MNPFGVVHRTTGLCDACGESHHAELLRRGDRLTATLQCPRGDREYPISSNAEMFLKIRDRSAVDPEGPPPGDLRFFLNYLSITNACNFHCAVCAADAVPPEEGTFLPAKEICARASRVRDCGGRLLHLFGGEPTLHPDLLQIVGRVADMGLSLGLVSNGLALGNDPELAAKLRERGLSRVCLQFDSFESDALRKMGRHHLAAKRKAVENVLRAGLALGLNCTVTEDNLEEVGHLLSHGLELGHGVRNMTFASASPIGRFRIRPEASADREQIVSELLRAGSRYGFSFDDCMPLPVYLPWGAQIHPDCGVHFVFIRTPDGVRPLGSLLDVQRLHHLMGRVGGGRGRWARYGVPLVCVLRSIRRGKFWEVCRSALGLLFSRRRYSLVNVGVSNYCAARFLDDQRVSRCASAFHTSVGPVRACLHFFMGADYPGSRTYEVRNGSC